MASTDNSRLPSGNKTSTISLPELNRGESPTLGCHECTGGPQTFKYDIYSPPEGHPVYDVANSSQWQNRSVFSMWGSIFDRPGDRPSPPFGFADMAYEGDFCVDLGSWTTKHWSNPSTAVIHMFHGMLWGGWQYQVSSFNGSCFTLGYGGYQEGRGGGISNNHFYVENVIEELDTPV